MPASTAFDRSERTQLTRYQTVTGTRPCGSGAGSSANSLDRAEKLAVILLEEIADQAIREARRAAAGYALSIRPKQKFVS